MQLGYLQGHLCIVQFADSRKLCSYATPTPRLFTNSPVVSKDAVVVAERLIAVVWSAQGCQCLQPCTTMVR
jgi:hypothetical protein